MSFKLKTLSGDYLVTLSGDNLAWWTDYTVKRNKWLFDIDQDADGDIDYRYSTKSTTYGGETYIAKVKSFSPIILDMGDPDQGIIPSMTGTIQISFADGAIDGLHASDFIGANITIRLYVEGFAGGSWYVCFNKAWRVTVINAYDIDQVLYLEYQDWFSKVLEGDFPNTPLVSELFKATIMREDTVCAPLIYGTPYFPLRWVSPNFTATYSDADTFTVTGDQTTVFAAGQHVICYCGVDGAKSCWVDSSSHAGGTTTVNLTAGSADLTANLTIAQINGYLLGASSPTYSITSMRTPRAIPGVQTFLPATYTFNQVAVTGSDSATYKVCRAIINDSDNDGTADSNGYWPDGDNIHDAPFRFSRSDTSSLTDPANLIENWLEAWGVASAEIDAVSQAAATTTLAARGLTFDIALWYAQKRSDLLAKACSLSSMILKIEDTIKFKVLSPTSVLEIDQTMIATNSDGSLIFSVSKAFTQKEKDSGYIAWQTSTEPVDKLIESLVAAKTTTAKPSADNTVECDWILDSEKAQKTGKLALQRMLLKDSMINLKGKSTWLLVEPGDVVTFSGTNLGATEANYNAMVQKMTIHEDLYVDVELVRHSDTLDGWDDLSPSAITLQEATKAYGAQPVYQGRMADGSTGTGANRITQSVIIAGGADITLEGSDTDPGQIIINGTTYSVKISGNTNGSAFSIYPTTSETVNFYLGYDLDANTTPFSNIYLEAKNTARLKSYYAASDYVGITVDASGTPQCAIQGADNSSSFAYIFTITGLDPQLHKTRDLGAILSAWNDAYADDWHNVADFFFLDHRREGETLTTVDDIEVIKAIKPSNQFDPKTGLALIDDDTLPEWMLSRNRDGGVARDPDGKPYLSIKLMISLLMGAIRQQAGEKDELKDGIEALKKEIEKLKEKSKL